ncbi:MAG: hypothetical protein U1E65_13865 [Myxococcota bacterium]
MSEGHLGEDLAAMAGGGGGLDEATRARHEAHLRDCPACSQALAEARTVFRVLGMAPAAEPSAGFDRALFAQLDAIDSERRGFLVRLGERLFGPGRATFGFALAGAGALGIALLVGGVVLRSEPGVQGEAAAFQDLEVAENLELYQNLDVVDNLDVADDLDLIESLGEGEPG